MQAEQRRVEKRLRKLYAKIPAFKCIPGCTKCCGVVPWSKPEFAHVMDNPRIAALAQAHADTITPMRAKACMDCPFYDEGKGCTVYGDRPFLCRLYGVAENLPCVMGVKPERMIKTVHAMAMLKEYMDIVHEYPVNEPGITRIKIDYAERPGQPNMASVVGTT